MSRQANPVASLAGLRAAPAVEEPPVAGKTVEPRPRFRWTRTISVLSAAVALVLAVTFGYRFWTRPMVVQVSVAEVGVVREETRGPGTIQSRFTVSVGSRMTGSIDRVLVDVGAEVTKDQLLATLDRTELEARAAAADRVVASARQDIALAEANMEKAKSDMDLARINYERGRRLVESGLMSAADLDQSRGAFAAAGANERAGRVAIQARRADLARFAQDRRVAETVLSYTSITSPMAGLVTRRALEPGSTVGPGVTIFQIVDPRTLWVATLIDESLARRVHVGQPATIHLRSGADVSGHVARITLEADPVTRELEVDVTFDTRPDRFAIHEEADVVILGAEARGLTIPLEAVVRSPQGNAVFVVESGKAVRRSVVLGVLGGRRTQVLEGLRAGEAVVLDPGMVRDGGRVVASGTGE